MATRLDRGLADAAGPRVELLTPQQLAADAACLALINAAQSVRGARCIHMDFEVDAEALAVQDAALMRYAVARSMVDGNARAPVAVMGVETDPSGQRAWLRGPFVASSSQQVASASEFARHADRVWPPLRAAAGAAIPRWDAFIETAHATALGWYAAQGFEPVRKHSNYIVSRADARYRAVPEAQALTPADTTLIDAVTALAARSFPGGYLSRDDFAQPASDEAITFVLRDGEQLLGYIRATYEPGASEVFIENLAVVETARQRGLGRLLLNAALHWAFDLRQAPQVGLTVKEGNSNAERLYQSTGFHLLAEGQHLRWLQPATA